MIQNLSHPLPYSRPGRRAFSQWTTHPPSLDNRYMKILTLSGYTKLWPIHPPRVKYVTQHPFSLITSLVTITSQDPPHPSI